MNHIFSVAFGACVQAAVLGRKIGAPSMYVRNVTPLTISLLIKMRMCVPVIKRNTAYPTEATILGTTNKPNQKRAVISLCEGEFTSFDENVVIGTTTLEGITPSPKGQELVDICVTINERGCILVSAIDRKTKIEA